MKVKTTPLRKVSKIVRKNPLNYWYYRSFKCAERFTVGGREFDYLYHPHNVTWLNERAVEIPIVWGFVQRHQGGRILEVGNVLSHYFRKRHTVVDKYEKADGVINEDVVDHAPLLNYDLIVSISTLEHVGWDEDPRDADKIPQAIANLRRLLNPGGQMLLTMPVGYNDYLDRMLDDEQLPFDQRWCLKRISRDNRWREVAWNEIRTAQYNAPYFYANALVVGLIQQ